MKTVSAWLSSIDPKSPWNVVKHLKPKYPISARSRSVSGNTVSFIARRPELEAEHLIMRIAAKRSFWKYRLEGPNPSRKVVYEGVGWRSTEVDRSRESIWFFFGRPDVFGSSDFHRIVIWLMLYRSIWISGTDFIKIMDLLEGRVGVGWGRSRSIEVDRNRESVWVFFGRPDGFGSSDFAQIVNVFMLYRSICVSRPDFIKHM